MNSIPACCRGLLLVSIVALAPHPLLADGPDNPPVLEFAVGLPGKQVKLSWTSEPGVRYRVEKSNSLGADGSSSGGSGGWQRVAMVEASGPNLEWRDPQAVTARCFYRVTKPGPEVFSISPPLLSPTGGTITVHGQRIPDGSFLMLEIEGMGPVLVPLTFVVSGQWDALISGAFPPGARVISARIVKDGGTLATIDQQIEITATGLATDGPAALPPAAPVPVFASKPVPGIGVIVKKHPPYPKGSHGRIVGSEQCDDNNLDPGDGCDALTRGVLTRQKYFAYQALAREAGRVGRENCDDKNPVADGDALMALWLSKKGYDYYQAQSAMASTGLQNNPCFVSNNTSGAMPDMQSSRPAPSGLPGEVSFQVCDLALPCPAGPPLAWIRTYRSMKPLSSGHGPQWDFSYNIRIEPLPATAGASAPRLVLHDGGGRSDVLHRQADGTYRCDGVFREGAFDGDAFTLTFADKGKWTFKPLDGSPAAGKISAITDRFGVALACAYDTAGRLQTVTDSFAPPRTLTVNWAGGTISSVEDSSGRSVAFSQYAAGETGGSEGDLKQATLQGFGPTVYTYASGNTDDALNHNLLEIRDGEIQKDGKGRLLEAFGYSADASGISYDTCTSHNRHALAASHVTLIKREMLPTGATPRGGYAVYETDEIGRVTETLFDAQHREARVREYTGYWNPGTAAGSADLGSPALPKTRSTDPDFYETSAKFNADHQCIQLTRPDGSQLRVTYDRDLRPGTAVRERGNARVLALRAASGEERTVSCDYLPGFGTPEPSARPGSPIKGISVKGGRNPGGLIGSSDRPGNPIKGMTVKGGRPGTSGGGISGLVWSPRSNFLDDDSDGDGYAARDRYKGWDGTIKGNTRLRSEGGRHTPFQNPYRPQFVARDGIAAGAVAGIVVAAVIAAREGGGPVDDIDGVFPGASSARHKSKGWDGTIKGVKASDGFVTRMVNAYGQSIQWGYDENGACTSSTITSLPMHGQLYQYNGRGQCTTVTALNGPASSFRNELNYDAATGFLSSVIRDKSSAGTGLRLTTSLHRDTLGRVIRVVDPMGSDWLYEYNTLDQCTLMQSPGPQRISVNLTYDNAGRVIRRDQAHLGADGLPVSSNPSYSTFYRYDSRGRLDQVADEERPVDGATATTAAALGIENFAVCDITRDPSGKVVRLGTPAACRAQAADLACDYVYDERGMLFRCISGGTGSANPVTLQYDYHPDGSIARRALIGSGVPASVETYGYDGFHRMTSITDAEGTVMNMSYDSVGFTDVSVHSGPDPGTGTGQLMAHRRMRHRPEMLFQAWENEIDDYLASAPFFDYLTEDDTVVMDRFTPGSADGPVATETTIIDRSPAGLVQAVTLNGDLLVSNEYDSAGRLIGCSNGACRFELQCDGRDDVVVCGRTDHFRVAGAPPSETFTDTLVRDSLGRVTQRTDGVGNVWTAAYDSFGRCVFSTAPGRAPVLHAYDGSSAAGPFAQQTSCDVAGTGTPVVLGSLLVRCGDLKSTTDSYGDSTVMTYDGLGRLVASTHPDGTSETTSFDSLGFLSGRGYRDGTTVAISTDALGRVTTVGWPGSPAAYGYDALGRCVLATQGTSSVAFAYDSLGNQVSETQSGIASAPQAVLRSFDHRGRTMITYPGGGSFAESRDEFGNLLGVSAAGAPAASPPVVANEYVGQRVWRSTQANGTVTVYNYRADGETSPAGTEDRTFDNCVSRTVRGPGGVVVSSSLTRRNPDQSTSRSETYFADGNSAPGRRRIFTRDNLGRITSCLTQARETVGGPFATETEVAYTLDLEGRRVSEVRDGTPGIYTQDDALPPGDRQAGQYSTWPGGALAWDDAGNLISMQKGTTTLEFVHDVQGRLVACNLPGGAGLPPVPVAEFAYDALGRVMIHKIHRGGGLPGIDQTRYVHDGGTCIQEWSDDGSGSGGFTPSLTMVGDGGLKHCISTRNGTLYYPVGGSAEGASAFSYPILPGIKCSLPDVELVDPVLEFSTHPVVNLLDAGGNLVESIAFDDSGKPVFLDSSGTLRPGATTTLGPFKWMAPECLWVPETGMFHGPGLVFSPDLDMVVSKDKNKKEHTKEYVGHVSLMK